MDSEDKKKSCGTRFIIWYRNDLRTVLNDAKYPLLFTAWIAVFIAGFIGFSEIYPRESAPMVFYLTTQIFVLPGGNFQSSPSLILSIARVGATTLLYLSLIALVAHSFYTQLELLWVRLLTRNHIVVCGLGDIGSIVVRNSFTTNAVPIVVIETDPAHRDIEWCRSHGIPVVIGSAAEKSALEQAGIKSARAIYVATGSDEINAKVIATLFEMNLARADPLTCYVHIIDPNFTNLLRVPQLAVSGITPVHLEFFNIFQIANFCVLECLPDLIPPNKVPPDRHVLIIGLGRMGEGLLIELAKRWQQTYPGKVENRIRITVIDRNAIRKKAILQTRYTSLSDYCEIMPCEIDINSPDFFEGHYLDVPGRKDPPDAIFICLSDETMNFSAGLYLNQKLQDTAVPIIIRTVHSTGLAHFFNKICPKHTEEYKNIHAFPLVSCSCCIESLIGMNELIARSIHRHYILMRTREGGTPDTDPAMKPWRKLNNEYKEASRSQAANIQRALQPHGYSIVARTDWGEPLMVFSDAEVEMMAEMEHDRWWNDKVKRGWTPGPRDLGEKTSPYLIPYDQLDERTKDYDRNFIRLYPEILAMVDLTIRRNPKVRADEAGSPATIWSCSVPPSGTRK
jgi:hypothetical protein